MFCIFLPCVQVTQTGHCSGRLSFQGTILTTAPCSSFFRHGRHVAPENNTLTPEDEMKVLLAQVAALSRASLEVTRACINITESFPHVVRAQVDAAVQAILPTDPPFVLGVAPTPDELDALFLPGHGNNQVWHVVCVGRHPGFEEADAEVLLIPGQTRRRKVGRQEALAYYRHKWGLSKVLKIMEVESDEPAAVLSPIASRILDKYAPAPRSN
ncbi:hypothetical protein DFH07DRAFT_951775 [Mycena maculata]|uniref:Uncharacterized protein n=1 Tax=Mycena maculata TaxID=230809 RepID=A0AAD7NVI1_9AGAR|nr:hypothetical protein DFH07DRAFT_951775 [Mycena maculata]